MCLYLSKILNAGLLLVAQYLYTLVIANFTWVKDRSTSSTTASSSLFNPQWSSKDLVFDWWVAVGVVEVVHAGFQSVDTAAAGKVSMNILVHLSCVAGVIVVDEQEETCRAQKDGHS